MDVTPAPGELLSSWLHRLALANGVPTRYFGRVLGLRGAGWATRLDRALPEHVLNLLVEQTRVPAEDIAGLTPVPDPLARLRLRLLTESQARHASGPQVTRLQYCPACLREDQLPYFRRGWTLATRMTCFRHGCQLRDTCPTCGGGIAPSRQDRLVPQQICVWCGGDLRKPTVRAEHDVQQLERLLDDLLRLHVAGHRLPGRTSLPALLATACFNFGEELKSIAHLSIRDRLRLFRQLADGPMPFQWPCENPGAALWARIARTAPTFPGLASSFGKRVILRNSAEQNTRPARPDLTDLLLAIGRLRSNRRSRQAREGN
ncbi:TniQ family protein [uncultured Aliiroseovarius sp.]|uniref:TniQ family protein n=1 Tax=Aliiroseovarius subalbicans TaxID=2925840 RepID=UPI00338F8791